MWESSSLPCEGCTSHRPPACCPSDTHQHTLHSHVTWSHSPARPSRPPLDQGSQNVPSHALLKPPLVHSATIMDRQLPPPHPSRSRLCIPPSPPNTQPGVTSHMVPPRVRTVQLCRDALVAVPQFPSQPCSCSAPSKAHGAPPGSLCLYKQMFVHIKPAPLSVMFPSAGKKKHPQSRHHLPCTQRGAQGSPWLGLCSS